MKEFFFLLFDNFVLYHEVAYFIAIYYSCYNPASQYIIYWAARNHYCFVVSFFFFWENNNQVFIIAWLNFDSYYYYGSESNRFCSVVLYNFIEEKKDIEQG